MPKLKLSRRQAMVRTGLAAAGALSCPVVNAIPAPSNSLPAGSLPPFRFCFNTATILGQKLGLAKEVELTARAGYQAIEPWVRVIDDYARSGGSLKEMKERISDLGLTVEGAIGFAEWIVDDDDRRARGFERMKRDMDLVAQIGGKRIAAPPAGANNTAGLDLFKIAERYRALLELGDQMGIVPQVELWGSSKTLHRLSECALVAIESRHPKACVLADVFHLYRGGSDFDGLRLLSAKAIQVFHLNDYPAEPPREKSNDSFRVFPGDGIAPLAEILRLLQAHSGQTVLSLELFSRNYWDQDAFEVAKTGLAKMKAVVEKALA